MTVTRDGKPLRTLARWVDGAFPDTVNPIAVWEVKEHYHTTSFGSRVSGAIYETLLDGLELEELRVNERVDVKHYLMVDAYKTWWDDGRSYLCRIIDMLHMGLLDEALFGYEVVERNAHDRQAMGHGLQGSGSEEAERCRRAGNIASRRGQRTEAEVVGRDDNPAAPDQALLFVIARTVGRSACVGDRSRTATVTTATVSPAMSKNSTL